MNRHLILVVIIVFSAYLSACTEGGRSASVTAEVYKEPYNTMSSSHDISPIAYRVNVTVKNNGRSPIVFDTVICAFVPAKGQPLLNKTYVYDKSRGMAEKNYRRDLNTDAIEPGSARMFSSTTNGLTFKLLRDASNLPLQFVFTLLKGNSTPALSVIGSHGASLPDIQALPLYNETTKPRGKEISLHLR